MTPAEAFAADIVKAINQRDRDLPVPLVTAACAADRERVASDLRAIQRAEAGLRDHQRPHDYCPSGWWISDDECNDALRYTEDRDDAWARLRLTGSVYGVTERPPVTGDVVDDGSQFGSVLL